MKKFTALLLVLVLAVGLLSGCGSKDERVVYVYNWGEYMDESLNDEFTAKTGIKVVYDYFDTNEALYALLKGGSAEYDVIFPFGLYDRADDQRGHARQDRLQQAAKLRQY